MGFDLDASCFGYDGSRLWCLPRARRAVNGRINVVDPSRQSVTYETRLLKYAERGFAVAVPGLEPQRIDASATLRPWHEVNGLARLLCVIKRRQERVNHIKAGREMNKSRWCKWEEPHQGQALCEHKGGKAGLGERVMNWFGAAAARGMDPDKPDGNAILCVAPDVQSRRMHGWRGDLQRHAPSSLCRLLEALNLLDKLRPPRSEPDAAPAPFESDYEDIVVDGRTTREVLKAISNKSFWHPGIDNHPFDATRCRRAPIVVASTRGNAAPARVTSDFDLLVDTPPNPLIVDLPGLGYQGYGPNRTASYTYVSSLDRRVEWITVDPGRQYIGSFRPLDNDWFKDAYLSNGAAKFSDDLLASFSTPRPELQQPPRQ